MLRLWLHPTRHTRAAWALCACAVLTMAPVVGWGQSAPSAGTGSKAVIAEFSSRVQAERRAASLRRQGRQAQVVKVVKPVSLLSVQLGYYKSLVAAQSAQASLRRSGIDTASVQRTTAGYAVVVGRYLSGSEAAREARRLRDLGHRNVRTERFVQMHDSYQVVELALPESAGAGPAKGTAANAGQKVTYQFTSARQADAKAAQLEREGYKVTRRSRAEALHLKNLQLRVFQQWSDARRIATRLERHGIPAQVINDPVERGYAVSAGAFSSEKNLRRRYEAIRKLGFRSVSVVPVQVSVTRYTVEGTAPAGSAVAKAPAAPAAAAGGEPQVMVFGGTPESFPSHEAGTAAETGQQKFRIGIDELRVEAGALTRSSQPVDSSNYLFGSFSARWRPSDHWEYRLAGRVDGYAQTGTPDYSKAKLDYGDSYVRYRGENVRVTAGAQTVIWGRVDEIPPEDRLSVQDVTRLLLDPLQERRRSVPALRLERFHGPYKIDALWVPDFRPAELPDLRSIWSPVDKTNGRLLGIESSPVLAAMVKDGSFGDDKHGQGGYGLRLSHTGKNFDYAVTLQRARRSLPYYELNEAARATLLSTGNPALALAAANGDTFVGRHPMSWVFGGDIGFQAKGATWRFEAAYLTDMPATTTDLRMITLKGIDWVGGVEFYPGDANARVNLQLAGHHLLNAPAVLDRTNVYSFNGSVENVFSYDRWRAKLRFSVGLNRHDVYLNPELAYIGWEPNEFYVGMHYFDGADNTLGGFEKNHSLIVLGWRAHY